MIGLDRLNRFNGLYRLNGLDRLASSNRRSNAVAFRALVALAGLRLLFQPAAVAQTEAQLDVLREAGVVDAGAAGLVELLRGVASVVGGQPLPKAPPVEKTAVEAALLADEHRVDRRRHVVVNAAPPNRRKAWSCASNTISWSRADRRGPGTSGCGRAGCAPP